jgi:hypothetical protein
LGRFVKDFVELKKLFIAEDDFGFRNDLDTCVVTQEFFTFDKGSDSDGDFDSVVGFFVWDLKLFVHDGFK